MKRGIALVLCLTLLGVTPWLGMADGALYQHSVNTLEMEATQTDMEEQAVAAPAPLHEVQPTDAAQATEHAPHQPEGLLAAHTPAQEETDLAQAEIVTQEGGQTQENGAYLPDETPVPDELPVLESLPEPDELLELEAGTATFGEFTVPDAKASESFTLTIPVRFTQGGQTWLSNADEMGEMVPYHAGQKAEMFDQQIAAVLADAQITLLASASGSPFDATLPQEQAVVRNGQNVGYAVFHVQPTDEHVESGAYEMLARLTWLDGAGETQTETRRLTVQVTGNAGTVTLGAHETPVAEVGGSLTLALPVDYTADGVTLHSNAAESGNAVSEQANAGFDQTLADALSEVSITVSADQAEGFPLDTSILSQSQSVLADGANRGYATFDEVPVLPDAQPGVYAVNLQIEWVSAQGAAQTRAVTTSIELMVGRSIAHNGGIIVFTYAELKAALTGTVNGVMYDTVYLGYCDSDMPDAGETKNDGVISFTSPGGIAVTRNVTIIGTDPRSNRRVRLIDYASQSSGDTIYAATGNISITLRNVDVTGNNFYGILYGAAYASVTLNFTDVTYSGRQLACAYGAGSVVAITDSHITLMRMPLGYDQEAAEAAEIVLSGNTTITKSTASDSLFWLKAAPYKLTVTAGANVTVQTPHYFLYSENSANTKLDIAGSLNVTTGGSVGSVTYAGQYVGTLTVENAGALNITHTNSNYASLRVNNLKVAGSLTVERAASSNPAIYLTGTAPAVFANPVRVSLSNASGALMGGGSTWTANINTQALNIWPLSGSAEKHIWNNNNLAAFTVLAGKNASVAVAQPTGLQNGKGVALPPYAVALSPATFNLQNAARVEFGQYALSIAPESVYRGSTSITGNAPAAASQTVREYALERNGGTVTLSTLVQSAHAVGASGGYQATLNSGIQSTSLSRIYTLSNTGYLEAHIYQDPESLLQLVKVPESIDYGTVTLSGQEQWVMRQTPNMLEVTVLDTRDSGGWAVTAQATTPLSQFGGADVLPNALVYRKAGQGEQSLSSAVQVWSQNTTAAAPVFTQLTWPDSEGILLRLQPFEGTPDSVYNATITWTLAQLP